MNQRAAGFCLLMLFVGTSMAQSSAPNGRSQHATADGRLDLVETTKIPTEVAATIAGPLRCDGDGNLYFMTDYDGETGIRKINKKGELLASFLASTAADPKIDVALYFSVGSDGTVYQVAFPHMRQRYVLAFGKDGVIKSEIKLDTNFGWVPSMVAPFGSGDLLVSGLKYNPDGADLPRLPFTGIFSSNGTLLKELTLVDDAHIRDLATSGDERVVPAGHPLGNSAVERGAMEPARDGNIYLMRNMSPAIIYAISPGGAVVRRFTVDSGSANRRPFTMHISEGRIAILFRDAQTHEQSVKIVDLEGHEIGFYSDTVTNGRSNLGIAFACFSENPERLTFLGLTDDNKMEFKVAEPR